jgi:glutamate/tyrosine decarboxylase-like PLP-dependent enzyme
MTESPLFPAAAARRRVEDILTQALADARLRVDAGPVRPRIDPAAIAAELAPFDFAEPADLDLLIAWTIGQLETGITHVGHPRYLGLFNPAPTFPAQCADRIAAAFNPQLASATTSPAAVAIESHTARALAARAGLPATATGHFCAGGSEANYTALLCALTHANPGFADRGARAFSGQPVFYISADSHLAWIKIAHQAGIGRAGARMIATDGAGRISTAALANAIAADRAAGHVPVMVAATAGTTNAGMIDPLPDCATLARDERLWFHVDAAWGGGALASDSLRPLLAGIERADSVTIDGHKWFATTMGCGVFLTAHPAVLSATFNVAASFMPSHAPDLDPYTTTAQWSRRFLGLRLFLSLAAGGWPAYAGHVEHAVALTNDLAAAAAARGWSVANTPTLAVACLIPPAGAPPVKTIVDRVVASGAAWLSAARFEGRDVVRACVVNAETTQADIAAVLAALEQYGLKSSRAATRLSHEIARQI